MTTTRRKLRKKVKDIVLLFVILSTLTIASAAVGKFAFESNTIEVINETYEQQEEAIEEIVKRVADDSGLSWLMVFRIVECESRWDRYHKEKTTNGGYDRGLFAFNSVHYKHVPDSCAFDPECATTEFAKAYEAGNINHWLCARLLGYSK